MTTARILSIIAFTLLFTACQPKGTQDTKTTDTSTVKVGKAVPDTTVTNTNETSKKPDSTLGDYNGDGKKEYAWLVPPEILEDDSCVGGCNSLIKFSDASIPSITVERCIDGHPDNLSNLNKTTGDEIGVSTQWFMGCWNSYNVYTLKEGKWIFAIEPFSTHCNQWEEGVVPIKKDPANPNNVIISYSVSTDEAIVVKTKSVPVK